MDLEYYHNKGQEDASDGNYDPPHGFIDELSTWSESGIEKMVEETNAYDGGYFSTKAQIDKSNGRGYNPPSSEYSVAKEAYDNAWEEWEGEESSDEE